MHSPSTKHRSVVKRILHYLKGTTNHGILLRYNSPHHLHAFLDLDLVGNPTTTRLQLLTSLFLVPTQSVGILESKIVACSSTKAKY